MVKRKAAAPVNGSARPSGEFAVEMWPIDKPIDYSKNARKWTQQAIDKVAMSIREFGWRQPVVVDSQGVIVIGHLRRLAGKSIGCTECPVHVARDLSPEKIRALRLADNRSGQEATWDMELLAAEFEDLPDVFTGFDLSEVDGLRSGFEDVDRAAPEHRNLGSGVKVKPVLYCDQIAVLERAIRATGITNRGFALISVCEFYLERSLGPKG